jgi:hypothetical protein
MQLSRSAAPVLGVVTRTTHQKGITSHQTPPGVRSSCNAQFVLLSCARPQSTGASLLLESVHVCVADMQRALSLSDALPYSKLQVRRSCSVRSPNGRLIRRDMQRCVPPPDHP